jgi:hypothetical protein
MIDPLLREDHTVPTSNKTLRQFTVLWLVFFGALACWEGYAHAAWTSAYVLCALAVTVSLVGLASPQSIRPLFVGLVAVTFPIGWVVSRVLLLALFYVVFTPVALFFRLIGRDALMRRPQPGKETYWLAKAPARDIRSYFHQS